MSGDVRGISGVLRGCPGMSGDVRGCPEMSQKLGKVAVSTTLRSQLFAGKGKHQQSQFGSRVSFAKSTPDHCWLMIFGSKLNDHCCGVESDGDLTPSTEAPTEPREECELCVSPKAHLLLNLGEALDSSQYTPPLRIGRGQWPVETLHLRAVDPSPAALLGRIVVRYGCIFMWPKTLLACRTSYTVLLHNVENVQGGTARCW